MGDLCGLKDQGYRQSTLCGCGAPSGVLPVVPIGGRWWLTWLLGLLRQAL